MYRRLGDEPTDGGKIGRIRGAMAYNETKPRFHIQENNLRALNNQESASYQQLLEEVRSFARMRLIEKAEELGIVLRSEIMELVEHVSLKTKATDLIEQIKKAEPFSLYKQYMLASELALAHGMYYQVTKEQQKVVSSIYVNLLLLSLPTRKNFPVRLSETLTHEIEHFVDDLLSFNILSNSNTVVQQRISIIDKLFPHYLYNQVMVLLLATLATKVREQHLDPSTISRDPFTLLLGFLMIFSELQIAVGGLRYKLSKAEMSAQKAQKDSET